MDGRKCFQSRRRPTRWNCDWSSDVCSSDLREDTDPDTAATFDVTGNRTTCGFDLTSSEATAVGTLQTEITECHRVASCGDARVSAFLLFAVFSASGLQHGFSLVSDRL